MFEGQEIKEATPSRRDFLLSIVVTGAVALPMFSPPARAAVSMLHTGLDPNLVESPSEIIPVGKRGGGGGQNSWFSPPNTSDTESSVKMRRIESAKVLAVESTVMLSGAPGRSGSVSVTTICSMPELS